MSKAILVTGVTGKQGGAVLQALLQHPSFSPDTHFIYALTRNTASPSATAVAAKSSAITLVAGDLNNIPAIFESLPSVPWGVFSVQPRGPDEVKQGKALVNASIRSGVSHFVYSSVDRGGQASDYTPTEVPHFKTKYEIEKHLEKALAGSTGAMSYTILRPVFFLENLEEGFIGKVIATAWRDHLPGKMQVLAITDLGFFGATALLDSSSPAYHNMAVSIAGDELTFDEANQIFISLTGQAIPTTFGPVASGLVLMVKDIRLMFKYLRKEGTAVDIAKARLLNPQLKSTATWVAGSKFGSRIIDERKAGACD